MHMGSKRYITVSSEHTSRTENNSLLVSQILIYNLKFYCFIILGATHSSQFKSLCFQHFAALQDQISRR